MIDTPPKPSVFIGSSKENLVIAREIQTQLSDSATCTVWTQVFDPSKNTLDDLQKAVAQSDFGVFVFAADDQQVVRGDVGVGVRDNVLFEAGIWIGKLGRERTFYLVPNNPEPRIPSDLRGLTLVHYDQELASGSRQAALAPACNMIRDAMSNTETLPDEDRTPGGLMVKTRKPFTTILLERLHDKETQTIRLFTYTNEVDGALLHKFHIEGTKKIEVYKRSILVDLAEQQEHNLGRLASTGRPGTWDKKNTSVHVSSLLEQNASVEQFLYDSPPSRRAYLFDDREAVIAHYQVLSEEDAVGQGSIYKGMTDGKGLHVNNDNAIGRHLIRELENYATGLRRVSRTWDEEKRVLFEGEDWHGSGKGPCLNPSAVFLDLDGVLFDSLPLFVAAWKEAFQTVARLDFPEEKVYLEEGRGGKDTIIRFLTEQGHPEINDALVDAIHDKKNEALNRKGPAKPMEGARDLLYSIRKSGMRIMVVTGSANSEHIGGIAQAFGGILREGDVVEGSQVRSGKPDPDPYLLACHTCQVKPCQAIVIENAPLGIASATQAGCFCLAVKTGPIEASDLRSAGARAVFGSSRDLADMWPKVLEVLRQ